LDKLDPLTKRIAATRAFTLDGQKYKARVLALIFGPSDGHGPVLMTGDYGDDGEHILAWSLVHDVLGKAPAWTELEEEVAA